MYMEDIRTMLDRVASGELSVDQAVLELKKEPFSEAGFDELGFAKLDTHRRLRQGIAEVIYGAGKTAEQIAGIVEAMKKRGQELVLITRMEQGHQGDQRGQACPHQDLPGLCPHR